MNILFAGFLGLIQGVTEFLPISSSGHLAIFQNFFGLADANNMFFDVLLHFGTFAAVCVAFWSDVKEMVLEFFRFLRDIFSGKKKKSSGTPPPARRMVLLVIIATLPILVSLFFKDKVEAAMTSTMFIGCALLVTGSLLYISDRFRKGRKTEKNATLLDALVVGLAQVFAVLPGISRSGTTISAGLFMGFDRKFAVRFAFLMSLPVVLGANILELKDAISTGIDPSVIPAYIVGVIVSAVSGFFAIRLVRYLTNKGKFGMFSYYCWVVGFIVIIATLFGFGK